MAYFAIAFIAPNYRNYSNQWLKAYKPGTTTPKAMALDSAAVTTVAKLQLNADGFLKSAGDALVIPYIDGAYDLWLFPTSAEADANDTSSAIRVADDINALNQPLINDPSQAYTFKTAALMQASLIVFPVGKKIFWQGYYIESDGGSNWGLVQAGTGTNDGGSEFDLADGQHVKANLKGGKVNARKFGAKGDGVSDDTAFLLTHIEYCYTNTLGAYLPAGTYNATSLAFTPTGKVSITGDGRDLSVMSLLSTSGTALQFSDSILGIELSGFSINCNFTTHGIGNHGIALPDCSKVRVSKMIIDDANNTAVISYSTDPVTPTRNTDVIFDKITVQGRGNTANGLLIVDATYSGINNSEVFDTTEFALELKNSCEYSWIRSCTVDGNDLFAIVLGQTSGTGPSNCEVSNINCKAIDGLIEASNGSFNSYSAIKGDFAGSPGTVNGCVNFSGNVTDSTIDGLVVRNVPTAIPIVRFRAGNERNVVKITYAEKFGQGNAVTFDATTDSNTVFIDAFVTGGVLDDNIDNLISDSGDNNLVSYTREFALESTHTNSSNTSLGDIANAINTNNKFTGKQVYNVSVGRPVYASGPLASDVWEFSDGTTSNTPS